MSRTSQPWDDELERLLDGSSLGTPEARRMRSLTDARVVDEILAKVRGPAGIAMINDLAGTDTPAIDHPEASGGRAGPPPSPLPRARGSSVSPTPLVSQKVDRSADLWGREAICPGGAAKSFSLAIVAQATTLVTKFKDPAPKRSRTVGTEAENAPRSRKGARAHGPKSGVTPKVSLALVAAAATITFTISVLLVRASHQPVHESNAFSTGPGETSVWLSKDRSLVHVNSGTGHPDAAIDDEVVGQPGDQEIVRPTGAGLNSGVLAVMDRGVGEVASVDTTTFTVEARVGLPDWPDWPDGPAHVPQYVAAGRVGYVIGETSVQPVDPVTLDPGQEAIPIGRVGGAVATAEGTLAVLDSEAGTVVLIDDAGRADPPRSISRDSNNDGLALSAVGGQPVVVDTDAGLVRRVGPGGSVGEPVEVDGLRGVDVADLAVADPSADGSTAWMVVRSTGMLIGVDLDTGLVRSGEIGRTGSELQAPVVLSGLVYVPDGNSHSVVVIDGRSDTLRQLKVHEPEGESDHLEVFAQDGRVWINDPDERTALVVAPNGIDARTIDKGPEGTVHVPNVIGMEQNSACAALAAEQLECGWETSQINSTRNPAIAEGQSLAADTPIPPGTTVSVYHPEGPDATLHRFQAMNNGEPAERWALAPDAGDGRAAHDALVESSDWRSDGSVGHCYSTQVVDSVPLYSFTSPRPNDPAHDEYFYAAGYSGDPNSQYQRGLSHFGDPDGILCYVVPWTTTGAQQVTEWWSDQDHYYTAGGPSPGPGFTDVIGHWTTW